MSSADRKHEILYHLQRGPVIVRASEYASCFGNLNGLNSACKMHVRLRTEVRGVRVFVRMEIAHAPGDPACRRKLI